MIKDEWIKLEGIWKFKSSAKFFQLRVESLKKKPFGIILKRASRVKALGSSTRVSELWSQRKVIKHGQGSVSKWESGKDADKSQEEGKAALFTSRNVDSRSETVRESEK